MSRHFSYDLTTVLCEEIHMYMYCSTFQQSLVACVQLMMTSSSSSRWTTITYLLCLLPLPWRTKPSWTHCSHNTINMVPPYSSLTCNIKQGATTTCSSCTRSKTCCSLYPGFGNPRSDCYLQSKAQMCWCLGGDCSPPPPPFTLNVAIYHTWLHTCMQVTEAAACVLKQNNGSRLCTQKT